MLGAQLCERSIAALLGLRFLILGFPHWDR